MSKRVTGVLLALTLCVGGPREARAQTLIQKLGALLTEQQSQGGFVPDAAAALATTVTVANLFAVELATLPVAASSGGFVYRLNPSLGTFERATDDFGPFFTERTLRNSRGQASIGFSYQVSKFGSLQGADLTSGTFPTNAQRFSNAIDPFSIDTLQLNLEARTASTFVSYGVTNKLTAGVVIPVETVTFSGTRNRTFNGTTQLQSIQSGSASGIGDIDVNGRYLVLGDGVHGFSIGGDLIFPTGNQNQLLGSGSTAGRMLAIGSWEEGQLAVHLNGGFGLGGVSREVFGSAATTFAATSRVTLVGELIGRRMTELNTVGAVYEPHPVLAGVDTMRWLPAASGVKTVFVVGGAKWNIARSFLLNTNLLFRVTDNGLTARVTPSVSFDYAFERRSR
jgi:hypothetical protein